MKRVKPKNEKDLLFKRFGKRISQGQINYLRAGHLDLFESERKGAKFQDKFSSKPYFDAFSSAGCFNVGRGNPEVVGAMANAAYNRDMGSPGMLSEAKIRFAKRLVETTPGDLNRVVLSGSGADAIESAIKLSRGATGRKEIICMIKAYHGHAGFSLSANGKEYYRELFEPLMPKFHFVPFGDLGSVRNLISKNTAAVMLEPLQGEGGIHVGSDEYLKGLRDLCDQNGALLIFDEIQSGFCRTGKFWFCEHSGVIPDILVSAKSISGGVFPNAAIIYRDVSPMVDFVEENPFFHTSFGGSDLGCVTSTQTIDYLVDNKVWEQAEIQGERLISGLKKIQERYSNIIREVRGKGLMVGLEYTEEFMGVLMADCLSQKRVFAIYSGNAPQVMRFQVPLSITHNEMEEFLSRIESAVKSMKKILWLMAPMTAFPIGRRMLNKTENLIPVTLFFRRFGL